MEIFICDDEAVYREEIARLLCAYCDRGDISCKTEMLDSSSALLTALEHSAPDAAFLDIKMGEMDGMELAREIRSAGYSFPIVFISSYDGYLQEGYEVRAFRYLLKHQLARNFDEVMDALVKSMEAETIVISCKREHVVLPIRDILQIESVMRHLRIRCLRNEYETADTLDAMEKRLPGFLRCHKGFLVNPRHVHRFTASALTLSNGATVPIGRKYAAHVLASLSRGGIS